MSIEEQKRLKYLYEWLEEIDLDDFIELFELVERYAKMKAKKGINIWSKQ